MSEKRQPKGISVGGQYAENSHDEAGAALTATVTPLALSDEELDTAVDSASAASVWTSSEAEEHTSETGEEVTLNDESRALLRSEIEDFAAAYPELIERARESGYTSSEGDGFAGAFGHDFVLTRNGEGAGFWDRPELSEGGIGDAITARLKRRGELDSFLGDDGYLDISATSAESTEVASREVEGALDAGENPQDIESRVSPYNRRKLSYVARRRLDDALGRDPFRTSED